MKLGEIDYSAPVEKTSQLAGAPYEAAAGLTRVISEGLTAYSQALLQTQQREAAVKVSEGLNQAENVIKAKKYVSAQEVRDTFGEKVPQHLAEQLQVKDPTTGQLVDNQQIPMWAAGDALYGHVAQRLVDSASQGISGGGWQADFKDRIAQHVVDRRQGMAQYQLGALDTYLQETQLQQIDRLVNAKDFTGAAAALAGSTALRPETRQKVGTVIESARQEAPAQDALLSTDPAVIKSQADRLRSDPAAIAAIPEDKRRALVLGLENRGRLFEAGGIAQELMVAKGTRNADGTPNLAALQGLVDTRVKDPLLAKEVMDDLGRRAHYATQAHDAAVSAIAAQAIQSFTRLGPDGQPQNSIAAVQLLSPRAWEFLTSPASGQKGAEVIRTLESWDEAHKAHLRDQLMRPTPAQAQRAVVVESWIYGHPEEVRGMPVGAFASQWMSTDPATGEALLSQADYQRLGNLFAQAHKPGTPFEVEAPAKMVFSLMKQAYPHLKTNEASWTPKQVAVANQLKSEVLERFGGIEKPDPKAIETFLKDRLTKIEVEGKTLGPLATDQVPAVEAKATGRTPVAAPKPAAAPVGRVTRTVNGETRLWDPMTQSWVKGAP